jgi:hypothetical protein
MMNALWNAAMTANAARTRSVAMAIVILSVALVKLATKTSNVQMRNIVTATPTAMAMATASLASKTANFATGLVSVSQELTAIVMITNASLKAVALVARTVHNGTSAQADAVIQAANVSVTALMMRMLDSSPKVMIAI